ncbi:MAG: hypothetical protein ACLQU1_29685 [Bryobacteraceae bacterium]
MEPFDHLFQLPFLGFFWLDDQPPGACIVYSNLNASFNIPITGGNLVDTGSNFTLTGPKGSATIPVNSGRFAEFNATGTFLVPGTYTVTGTGGADVG